MYNFLNLANNDEIMSKNKLTGPQRNRNANANFVDLIMTSTVHVDCKYAKDVIRYHIINP